MPLTPNFTSSESLASPNLVTFQDTSDGTDNTIVERRIYCLLADGTYLVPSGTTTDYILWDYNDTSIQLDLLTKSQTSNVTVEWWSNSAKVYDKTILMEWDLYDYLFLFGLLQVQTSTPRIIDDTNYYDNCYKMLVNLFNSENATTKMGDLYSSQAALDKNQYLMQNQNLFF